MKEWQDELEDISFEVINPDAKKTIIERLDYLKSKDDNIVDDPTEISLQGEFISNIEIFELVTPNKDNKNDYFIISGIEDYPNNNLQIYNRWGVIVFEVDKIQSCLFLNK